MPTQNQIKVIAGKLKSYKKKYIKKQYASLDESATRLMINSFLTEVLGYAELDDIKTEYRIRGEYADYVIQLARKKHFVVEVKSIQLDLTDNHLRQSLNYAANEGVEWVILTNGKQIALYRVIFGKPINSRKVFEFDLSNNDDCKIMPEFIFYLTKKSIEKNDLNNFWKRFQALEPVQLSKNLYDGEVVKFLRKVLKKKTGLFFCDDDILDSIHAIITKKIESNKPKTVSDILGRKRVKEERAKQKKVEDPVMGELKGV